MPETNVTIRMDKALKNQFDDFCKNIGMSMTTAFCIFAETAVKQQKIPFEYFSDPFYSEANMERLKRSMEQMEQTGGTVHEVY